MKYISDIAHLSSKEQEIIKKRIKVIEFFNQFGKDAAKQAFDKSKSIIYLWKQKLKNSQGRLSSLKSESKAPKNRRQRETNIEVKNFIKQYREKHPGVSKETIKPTLDAFCLSNNIQSVSESTIGRIIKDLKDKNIIPNCLVKITISGKTGKLFERQPKSKEKKLRINGYKPKNPGDLIQIDAISIFIYGLKRYIICAIDIKTRFAFACSYKTLSSKTATDFMIKFQKVSPFKIKRIQTDNGSEFHKYFRAYVKEQNIIHYYNYPRHPKSNCYVECFNGVIQRQYINHHLNDLINPQTFNRGLMEYLIWYNTEKQHKNLNKIPPLLYYLNNYIFNQQKSNMLWTTANT